MGIKPAAYYRLHKLSDTDCAKLAKILGIKRILDGPRKRIQAAIRFYCARSNEFLVRSSVIRSELKLVEKATGKLIEILEKISYPTIDQLTVQSWVLDDLLHVKWEELAQLGRAAKLSLKTLAPDKGGRSRSKWYLQVLISDLARIYPHLTGEEPTQPTLDPSCNRYHGKFLDFVIGVLEILGDKTPRDWTATQVDHVIKALRKPPLR
jgi:hypothetical protein